jgi:hypothetical protein
MSKSTTIARLFLLFTSALAPGGMASADQKDPMEPLARFAGEWKVEGQWAGGEKLQARTQYEWGLGKKILKARTYVINNSTGKEYQRYEGIMAWHPKKKCLYQVSFAYDGNIGEVVIDAKDPNTLYIGYTPFHADQPENVRQILKFTDNDHFVWTVTIKQGDEWKQLIEATWARKDAKSR